MDDYSPLSARLSDPKFLDGLARLTVQIAPELDEADVCLALGQAAQAFGADGAAFGTFVKDDEAFDSYRAVLACDPAWCLAYEDRAGYMDDPWLEHARHSSEATLTQDIRVRTPQQQQIVDLARQHGQLSGIVIPIHSPSGLTRIGALLISSSHADHFTAATLAQAAYAATGLALRLHSWQAHQLRNELLSGTKLSSDDMALLGFELEGKGSKEVARLLGTTSLSVDSRWQRLNAKLGVTSRAMAARIAAEFGLI